MLPKKQSRPLTARRRTGGGRCLTQMFLFFSNRLGCLGSVVLSLLLLTLLLLWLFNVF